MKKVFYIVLINVFLLISCSTVDKTKDKSLVRNNLQSKQGLFNQDINAKIKINMPDMKNTANTNIKLLNKDTIAIEIYGPFSVKLGYLWSDKDNFVFLNYFQSMAFTGTPSAENFEMSAMIDLSFEDLISIFRAEPIAEISEYETKDETDDQYIFMREIDENAEFILVNKSNNEIKQYQRQNAKKETVLNIFLENYVQYDKFLLPDEIVANIPEQNGSITFIFEERKINIPINNIEKPMIPNSFKTTDLDKLN